MGVCLHQDYFILGSYTCRCSGGSLPTWQRPKHAGIPGWSKLTSGEAIESEGNSVGGEVSKDALPFGLNL